MGTQATDRMGWSTERCLTESVAAAVSVWPSRSQSPACSGGTSPSTCRPGVPRASCDRWGSECHGGPSLAAPDDFDDVDRTKPIVVQLKTGEEYGFETAAQAHKVYPDAKVVRHQDGTELDKDTPKKADNKPADTGASK